jgi:tRNA modification GTPase
MSTGHTDTIIALSTPPGTGAIGVVRLSGPDAVAIAGKLFHGKDLSAQPSHTLHYGTLRQGDEIIDEVVIGLFRGPHSYTGEDVVEISCHGSPFILQRVIEVALQGGARLAGAGEFTQRAFLHGKLDLSQAEAVADLIASESEAQHRLAMQQMRGGYSGKLGDLRQQLIDFTALIELELDFAEEDVEFADRGHLVKLVDDLLSNINELAASFRQGNAIRQGIPIVIAGRPNAGKSTLLNALLQEERAIVSDIAGTTRDTIEEALVIDGVLFRMVDTAGIREAGDVIEHLGIQRTYEKIATGALVLYIFGIPELTLAEVQADLAQLLGRNPNVVVVANKEDAASGKQVSETGSFLAESGHSGVAISAKAQTHIAELKHLLVREALGGKLPEAGSVTVSNLRHYEALRQAAEALTFAREGLTEGRSGDLVAHDLRSAIRHIGSITGEIEVDRDILGAIFSRFCIGK